MENEKVVFVNEVSILSNLLVIRRNEGALVSQLFFFFFFQTMNRISTMYFREYVLKSFIGWYETMQLKDVFLWLKKDLQLNVTGCVYHLKKCKNVCSFIHVL